jgi:bacterioferritin-associated ferredoxin
MHICHCRPSPKPLDTDSLVATVKEGASSLKEVVAKTGAGTNCHTCVPQLLSLKPVIKQLADERKATGAAWPSSDQLVTAKKTINDAMLK